MHAFQWPGDGVMGTKYRARTRSLDEDVIELIALLDERFEGLEEAARGGRARQQLQMGGKAAAT